jgi:hypothetical protein
MLKYYNIILLLFYCNILAPLFIFLPFFFFFFFLLFLSLQSFISSFFTFFPLPFFFRHSSFLKYTIALIDVHRFFSSNKLNAFINEIY